MKVNNFLYLFILPDNKQPSSNFIRFPLGLSALFGTAGLKSSTMVVTIVRTKSLKAPK